MVPPLLVLLLLSACCVHCKEILNHSDQKIKDSHPDIVTEFITKANTIGYDSTQCIQDCSKCSKDCPEYPELKAFDCADVLSAGHNTSGVYEIWLMSRYTEVKPVRVYCDMDTDGGGWTVIQRRGDFGSPKDYFDRDWKSYKEGFGDVEKDFWLGNENIFALTNQKLSSVRFDLMDANKNRRYALYDNFWISCYIYAYAIHISNYSGDAGDAMQDLDNDCFTTKDVWWRMRCPEEKKGGWWLYRRCTQSNLNGIYYKGDEVAQSDGITWIPRKGEHESLEWTEIKVRPKNFRASQE